MKKRRRSVKKRSTFSRSIFKGSSNKTTSAARRLKRIILGIRSTSTSSTKVGAGASTSSTVIRKNLYSMSHKTKLKRERELARLERIKKPTKKEKARINKLREA